MLITSLDGSMAHWDEDLLAAVVILRLYEELSQGETLHIKPFTLLTPLVLT